LRVERRQPTSITREGLLMTRRDKPPEVEIFITEEFKAYRTTLTKRKKRTKAKTNGHGRK
jgi:hypothetical protein